ncbi:hypothetical protein [Mammaliicoccus sciuri]|nr:hypothetical protein [Mammaliicoccus sciuri]MEB7408315.1 hypothetical protein [Mammaliicoccus sciuri]
MKTNGPLAFNPAPLFCYNRENMDKNLERVYRMSEYKDDELERINKEIEAELENYDPNNDINQERKQFLSLRFLCSLILVTIILISIIRLFM